MTHSRFPFSTILPLNGTLSSSEEHTVYNRSDAFNTDTSVWHVLLVASKQTLISASTANLLSDGMLLTLNLEFTNTGVYNHCNTTLTLYFKIFFFIVVYILTSLSARFPLNVLTLSVLIRSYYLKHTYGESKKVRGWDASFPI